MKLSEFCFGRLMVVSAFVVKRSFFSDSFRDSFFQAEIFCVFAVMTLRLHFCSPFTLVATFRGSLTFGGGSVAADHGPNIALLSGGLRDNCRRPLSHGTNELHSVRTSVSVEGRQLCEQISRRKPVSAEARFCCPTVRVPVELSGAVDNESYEKLSTQFENTCTLTTSMT